MSLQLDKFAKDGKQAGNVTVAEDVFGIEPNRHVLHQALRRELANGRGGNAHSKTRSEVRGGGKKPWRQKGTGRARAGSIRSPLWVGGGVIFGPRNTVDYSIRLPKKIRALAIRSSLSAAKGKFRVVEDFSFLSAPKTREAAGFLNKLGLAGQKVLVLADYKAESNANLQLSVRNLPNVKLSLPGNLSVKDLLEADAVIVTHAAIEEINERYSANA